MLRRGILSPAAFRPRPPPHRVLALYLLAAVWLAGAVFANAARAAIQVDGRLDEPEWQDAARCTDWRRTQPLALDAPRYRSDVRVRALPEGLAAAFTIDQPPSERRMKPRTPRDAEPLSGESVGLIVDFDATGQVGYEFTVGLGGGIRDGIVTNQNEFNRDWDGIWQHAVRETDEQWFVEMLIPWASINMRESGGEQRTIGIYATRYLFDRGERYSCPGIGDQQAVFLSDFQRVQVAGQDPAATFDFLPYTTVISDQVREHTTFKAGADINWKPSPNLWLSAALNPDFGQVESDELVVDFSAIETLFTDKRPFFTENQGIFDLRTPANGMLVYTRRVGGAPDDFSTGSSDIDAALKLSGTRGALVYGAFVAQEDDYTDDFGRLFAATRLSLPFERLRIGHLATWTEHPLLNRDALVNAVDYEFKSAESWRLSGQVIRSDIDANEITSSGYETWLQADFNRYALLKHSLKLLYIDAQFDMNDLGYMERNALRQVEWETNRSVSSANPASRVSGETQRLYLVYKENAAGDRLQPRLQVSRDIQYANAWRAYQELRYLPAGVDDLISRGNGIVRLDDRMGAYFDMTSPRLGNWVYVVGAYLFQQGVQDYSAWLQLGMSWYPHEDLTLRWNLLPQWSDDWLLWTGDRDGVSIRASNNLFGSYRSERLDLDFRVDWIPSPRHELRLKFQWIGLQAQPRAAYRSDPSGRLRRTGEPLDPFTVNNLGLQIRYRFEFAPLSDLFLVYARGGFDMRDADERGVDRLFQDLDGVRDADQFLVKVRFRL
jgi:hypothetical protein